MSDDARPNSPEDAGFTDEARQPFPRGAPLHEPRTCSSCPALIFWAQILGDDGRRIPRDDGKGWRSMPVDAEPVKDGNVVLWHRKGEGIVAKVLKRGEHPPPATNLRTSHFATCPNAARHRRKRS